MDADVLIVGGGPVGLGLAIELGQRGVRCILSERYLQPQPIPKGQNLTQRTMEHLHFWGAEKELRSARTIPPEYGIGGLTTYGTLLGKYSYNWLQRELVKPYYFCANERLPQYATENVLRQRVAQLPSVQTLFGWDAEAVAQDADGVSITVSERKGQQRRTLRGRLCGGLRWQPFQSARTSRHHANTDRPRPLDGSAGVSLA
jgi:2-polyprenyl-6-methoxyphenol hydroxylase-like FAD-dependent oxidoreductase